MPLPSGSLLGFLPFSIAYSFLLAHFPLKQNLKTFFSFQIILDLWKSCTWRGQRVPVDPPSVPPKVGIFREL